MTYATNTAGRAHAVIYELRIGSGRRELVASTASGASLPLKQVVSVGASLDPISGRRTLAGVSVEILNTPAALQVMGPAHTVQTALAEEATTTATTFQLERGGAAALNAAMGAFPWDLQIGAESVRATAANIPLDQITVTRAMGAAAPPAGMVDPYETLPQYHAPGSPIGYQPQVWVGRPMALFAVYADGTEAALGWYACDDLPSFQDGIWTFPCQDLMGLYNVPLGRGMGELTTGGKDVYLNAAIQDARFGPAIGARYVSPDFGALAWQLVPYRYVGKGGDVDGVVADFYADQGAALGFSVGAFDPAVPTGYFWPNPGGAGGTDPQQAISSGQSFKPAPYAYGRGLDDALLQLIARRLGNTANGPYDYLPGNAQAQSGAGIPQARINTASFNALRPLAGGEAVKVSFEPGELLLDVMERELAWFRYFLTIDENGFLAIKKIEAAVHLDAVDVTLNDSTRSATQPDSLMLAGRHVGQVTLNIGFDPSDGEYSHKLGCPGGDGPASSLGETVEFSPTSLMGPSLQDLDVYEAELIALSGEYGVRHPLFKEVHDYRLHQAQIGQSAAVIQPRLPSGDGTTGINAPGLITATEINLEAGTVTLEVEALGPARGGYFAPAGQIMVVAAVVGTTYNLTLNTAALSSFTSGLDLGGTDADEAEYFAAGWRIRGYTATTGATTWVADVDAVAGAVLRVTVVGATVPLVGELLTVNSYGAFGTTPETKPGLDQPRPGLSPVGFAPGYLYLADATATLGAGPDAAMEWSL